jgi:cation transport ATPase
VRTLVFDKTGTLTSGSPRVASIEPFGDLDPAGLLQMAASLDQVSPHVFADGIVTAARERHLTLEFPEGVEEHPGRGIEGTVAGHRVSLGQARWLLDGRPMPERGAEVRRRMDGNGASAVFVSVDGQMAGALVMVDPLRDETPEALRILRQAGIGRIVLLSGDRDDVAGRVGATLGVDEVLSEHTPEQKVEAVSRERRRAVTVMVGDGVNDAPALAAADVGIAMGARGATASSEAADAVMIARHARHIAVQSVVAGMVLSVAGMLLATAGILAPVAGAFFQEAIDVAVILNALRALSGGTVPVSPGR